MGGLGETLRAARERKGVSLKQAEEATKIRSKYLEALEREDFGALPGKVYAIGFAKTYAKFLGLNSEEVAHQCRSQLSELDRGHGGEEDLPATVYLVPKNQPWRRYIRATAAFLVVLCLLLGAYWAINHVLVSSPALTSNNHPSTDTPRVPPETSHPGPTNPSNPPAEQGLELNIRIIKDECWVSITSDGVRVYQGLIRAGDQKTVIARREIIVRLGNAGVVSLSLNGQDLGIVGKPGQVVTKRFTAP
ncbi:MAG: helix-turn-helix domain-containing protein [Clostridia bacterium]|nr:helix-turn-helix domain-containing protein [Clostridia bacterium]